MGAGKIGRLVAHLLAEHPSYDVTVADIVADGARQVAAPLPDPVTIDATDSRSLHDALQGSRATVCCLPFNRNREVAAVARTLGIHYWLAAVERCAAWDPALAREVASAAQLVKGYGDVRRRMTALFDDLLDTTLAAAAHEATRAHGFPVSTALAATYRRLVLKGPDAEAQAQTLAANVRAQVGSGDHAAALALVSV